MQRRRFGREFKLEAVKLVRERGVAVVQAARDLDVHENVLHKWVKERHVAGKSVQRPPPAPNTNRRAAQSA
jgi:transposase-like protein